MSLFRTSLFVIAAAAGVAAAQRAAEPERPNAVFRATTRLVQVDVTVVDAQGAAVPGLGPTDFVLTQEGQAVPVQFATLVSGLSRGAGADAADVARIPTRLVFFVDDYHLSFENFARVRAAFAQFMSGGVVPGTEMLVMPASFFGDKHFAFTTQPAAVQRDIEAVTFDATSGSRPRRRGGPLGSCENLTNDLRSEVYSSGTLGTLSALLTALQQIDGRKAVVVLTDGLFHACRDEADAPERLRRLTDLANRSSVVLYGIHTAGFSSSSSNMADDDLIYLAERTGGIAGRSNAISQVLDRVMADQQAYYLLAYEPPAATFKKGRLQYREVKVATTRPGLKVRTRAGFYNVPDASLVGR